jgi:hypothetical protein
VVVVKHLLHVIASGREKILRRIHLLGASDDAQRGFVFPLQIQSPSAFTFK